MRRNFLTFAEYSLITRGLRAKQKSPTVVDDNEWKGQLKDIDGKITDDNLEEIDEEDASEIYYALDYLSFEAKEPDKSAAKVLMEKIGPDGKHLMETPKPIKLKRKKIKHDDNAEEDRDRRAGLYGPEYKGEKF